MDLLEQPLSYSVTASRTQRTAFTATRNTSTSLTSGTEYLRGAVRVDHQGERPLRIPRWDGPTDDPF